MPSSTKKKKLISWRSYLRFVLPRPNTDKRCPWKRAVRAYLRRLIKAKDFNTRLLFRDLDEVIASFPQNRTLFEIHRNLSTKDRAGLILTSILRQGWNTLEDILVVSLATELHLRQLGLSDKRLRRCVGRERTVTEEPWIRYREVSRSIAHLMKADVRHFTTSGITLRKIYRLQSRYVAKRLFELVEPCYREWFEDHRARIETFKARRDVTKLHSQNHR